MRRRTLIGSLACTGVVAVTGLGALRGHARLADPTVLAHSPRRRALEWRSNDEPVGSLGVSGGVSDGAVALQTELWHRRTTRVRAIDLRVWAPGPGAASVAVEAPVQGDASPPPDVSLSTTRDAPGTLVAVDDFDDLADETVRALALRVTPRSGDVEALAFDATVRLDGAGWFDAGFTLTGRLDLEFPGLASA